jgi:hypothetical protein
LDNAKEIIKKSWFLFKCVVYLYKINYIYRLLLWF